MEEALRWALKNLVRRLLADTRGTTAIEYGLIAVLIAVACIGGFKALGQQQLLRLGQHLQQAQRRHEEKRPVSSARRGGGAAASPAGNSTVPSASASRAFARAGLQRLLLALVRRPGGQRQDLEGRRHAAVRQAEALLVDLERAHQGGAAQRRAAAGAQARWRRPWPAAPASAPADRHR